MEEKTIRRGVEVMSKLDPERTPEQHEKYVRALLSGIEERLVLRCLYDGVVRELQRARGVDV